MDIQRKKKLRSFEMKKKMIITIVILATALLLITAAHSVNLAEFANGLMSIHG
ncbi:MAG: hypothetical protein PF447_07465 [Spirochaetaceae bacterium]|nr:hypothetical protein [Spirochaetaceae bacterium]